MAGEEREAPSTREVRIGTNVLGMDFSIRLWGTNTIIAGGWGSGVNNLADHLLAEVLRIPEADRYVAAIDLHAGMRLGRWRGCLDALATSLAEADRLLDNIQAELDRRQCELAENPETGWVGGLTPNDGKKLIVLFVDELAVLANRVPLEGIWDVDGAELRNTVAEKLLYVTANAKPLGATVISTTHHPGYVSHTASGILSYTNRLCGLVPVGEEAKKVLRCDAYDALGLDSSKLDGHWFLAAIENPDRRGDVDLTAVRSDYEEGDEDLHRVANEITKNREGGDGASWLLAEPGSDESIPLEQREGAGE